MDSGRAQLHHKIFVQPPQIWRWWHPFLHERKSGLGTFHTIVSVLAGVLAQLASSAESFQTRRQYASNRAFREIYQMLLATCLLPHHPLAPYIRWRRDRNMRGRRLPAPRCFEAAGISLSLRRCSVQMIRSKVLSGPRDNSSLDLYTWGVCAGTSCTFSIFLAVSVHVQKQGQSSTPRCDGQTHVGTSAGPAPQWQAGGSNEMTFQSNLSKRRTGMFSVLFE